MRRSAIARLANADCLSGLATAALGLAALWLVPAQVAPDGFARLGEVRSPAFFPILAAALTLVLSLALVLRGLLRPAPPTELRAPGRVLPVGAALVLAAVLVFPLGYLVTAALLIVALSYAFGGRRHAVILAMAVLVPVAIQLLFVSGLNVLLPEGPF